MGKKINEIVLATTNRGKLAELEKLLMNRRVQVRVLPEFDKVEAPIENGATLAENARLKARHYSQKLDRVVLADDSGLEVEALQGRPGVHSARFAGDAEANRQKQDQANIGKLLEELTYVPPEKRRARFCCCLCLADAAKILLEVEGALEGAIAQEPRGINGFGYDPVFWLPQRNKTVAQLSQDEKNAISHRGAALRKLMTRWEEIDF
jgi:XTP/dITP diphosphohydrolase